VDVTGSRGARALCVRDSRRAVLDCGKRRPLSLRLLVEASMRGRRILNSAFWERLGEDRDKRLVSLKRQNAVVLIAGKNVWAERVDLKFISS
jgi:hypothetical protein